MLLTPIWFEHSRLAFKSGQAETETPDNRFLIGASVVTRCPSSDSSLPCEHTISLDYQRLIPHNEPRAFLTLLSVRAAVVQFILHFISLLLQSDQSCSSSVPFSAHQATNHRADNLFPVYTSLPVPSGVYVVCVCVEVN